MQSNLNSETKRILNFDDLLWLAIFEIFRACKIRCEGRVNIPPAPVYSKNLQVIDPLFVTITKKFSDKIGERASEELKLMCKLSKIDGQKYC